MSNGYTLTDILPAIETNAAKFHTAGYTVTCRSSTNMSICLDTSICNKFAQNTSSSVVVTIGVWCVRPMPMGYNQTNSPYESRRFIETLFNANITHCTIDGAMEAAMRALDTVDMNTLPKPQDMPQAEINSEEYKLLKQQQVQKRKV